MIPPESDEAVGGVSSVWLEELVQQCQLFAGVMAETPFHRVVGAVSEFAEHLQDPQSLAEYFAQRSLLLDISLRLGPVLHRRAHGKKAHKCAFDACELTAGIWLNSDSFRPPRASLVQWTRAVFETLSGDQRFHEIQQWVDQRFAEPLRTSDAAQQFSMSQAQLNASFTSHLGVSFARYHKGLRLVRALEKLLLEDLKVEAIARDVGFKSKKNLYEALDKTLGMTPGRIRSLAASRQIDVRRVPFAFRSEVRSMLTTHSPALTPTPSESRDPERLDPSPGSEQEVGGYVADPMLSALKRPSGLRVQEPATIADNHDSPTVSLNYQHQKADENDETAQPVADDSTNTHGTSLTERQRHKPRGAADYQGRRNRVEV